MRAIAVVTKCSMPLSLSTCRRRNNLRAFACRRSRAARLSGCAPCRLRRHSHSASILHVFAPAALRAALASLSAPSRAMGRMAYATARCAGSCDGAPSWTRAVAIREGWLTDMPHGLMERFHTALHDARGRQRQGVRAVPVAGCRDPCQRQGPHPPGHSAKASTWATAPFGRPVAHIASFACCASWQGRGCASGFLAATVRRKQFPLRCAHSSRSKFFAPPGPPRALRPLRGAARPTPA